MRNISAKVGCFLLTFLLLPTQSIRADFDYPFSVNFLSIRPVLPPFYEESPGEGHWSVRTTLRWINVWSFQRSRFIIDGEEEQIEASVKYAFTDSLLVTISIPYIGRGGGTLDRAIERAHQVTGVTQGGRDRFERNVFNVSYEPYGSYYFLLDNFSQGFLRRYDYRLYPRKEYDPPFPLRTDVIPPFEPLPPRMMALLRGNIYDYLNPIPYSSISTPFGYFDPEVVPLETADRSAAGDPKLHLQVEFPGFDSLFDKIVTGVTVKIPGHSGPGFSTPGLDTSISLLLRREVRNPEPGYSLGASFTKYFMTEYYGIDLPAQQTTIRAGIFFPLSDRTVLEAEYINFSRPTRGMGSLSRSGHQIAVGVRKKNSGWSWQAAMVEDIINFGVSPDIGFVFGAELFL
jgi:hypothetical protein